MKWLSRTQDYWFILPYLLAAILPNSSHGISGFPAQSEGDVGFTLDAARFRIDEDRIYLELYYEVPFEGLTYVQSEGRMKASFRAVVEVREPEGAGTSDTVDRVSYVPSLKEARSRDLSAVDQYEIYPLNPGEYEFALKVIDLNSGKEGHVARKVPIEPWGDELAMSDVQLTTAIEQDTTYGQFTKRGLRITPNPTREFGNKRKLLHSYSEIYNLKGEGYQVRYSILDEAGSVVKELPERKFQTPGKMALEVGAMSVIDLPAGNYTLRVEVADGVGSAASDVSFTVAVLRLPEVYGLIEYVATQAELRFYESLSESGKKEYLLDFWKRRDPTPDTPRNEALEAFALRVIHADSEYGSQLDKGRDTDRGRTYIRYGRPDEVERHPAEMTYKPYESWLYYGGGGKQFIFVDHSGYGNYELVYSSVETELTDPNWYKYVDPSAIQIRR